MTKYKIKRCESPYRVWYQVQVKMWWWPFWMTFPSLKYCTEEEARKAIALTKKNSEKYVIKVSYIKDV